MKRAATSATVKAQPRALPPRIWRVFEYRRPLPIRQPRFTT